MILHLFYEKNHSKKQQIFKKMRNLKIGHLEKAIARAKAIVFAKYSVQVKKFK